MAESEERNDEGDPMTFRENDNFEIPKVFPSKLLNPTSFSIPCVIGKVKIEIFLCDLRTSVSLMPYFMFHKHHSGPLQPTFFSLQIADGSETRPLAGECAHKNRRFWMLEDFIIADMTETNDAHIILGKPFLLL